MNKYVVIGVDIAIIALIAISLFTNGSVFRTGSQESASQSSPYAHKARTLARQTPQ